MTVVQYDDVLYESLEIRVLGPLRVRRANGTVVQPGDWLTAQTADLLRLLALRVNEPVAVDVLVEALWPKVDETRGRASLRNAASRLRKILGEDCVQRRLGGLVLTGAWVDAHAFRTLAHQARREVMAGAFAKVVTTTREAEAVYLGEFRAQNDGADWGLRERDTLAATYRSMIADAAEAAAALGWWHDAVDFAERTLQLEPVSERAFRVLMTAQHGLGETALALKTYDRCRRVLAEDVGADPSAETRDLHRRLLADEPVTPETPAFSGRAYELEWLTELVETSAATAGPTVVSLTG
jgi:DNA-binding SARP family transcriptional activator